MGFQFVHFEGYARSAGSSGRTVDFVLAEADRRPDASVHVATPTPPEVVWGMTVAEVRAAHDSQVVEARDTMSNGRTRAVRSTQKTLGTVIASHPATMAEVRADPATAASVADWERRTVAWLQECYGNQVVSVIRHIDEAHAHLHAYILPAGAQMKFTDMHPGQIAKAQIMDAGPLPDEDSKALNRRGDKAYRAAMRSWQDAYFQSVGAPCGLARVGPGRRRLSREEWRVETQQAGALRAALQRAERIKAQGAEFISGKKDEAAAIVAEANHLKSEADARMSEVLARHDRAIQTERRAERMIRRAREEVGRLQGLGAAVRALWDGLRVSHIRQRVENAVRPQIEAWQAHANEADKRALTADRKRRDAEERTRVIGLSASELGAQRDELRARLASYESSAPSFAPAVPRLHR